jgi:hypothetical protein
MFALLTARLAHLLKWAAHVAGASLPMVTMCLVLGRPPSARGAGFDGGALTFMSRLWYEWAIPGLVTLSPPQ